LQIIIKIDLIIHFFRSQIPQWVQNDLAESFLIFNAVAESYVKNPQPGICHGNQTDLEANKN